MSSRNSETCSDVTEVATPILYLRIHVDNNGGVIAGG